MNEEKGKKKRKTKSSHRTSENHITKTMKNYKHQLTCTAQFCVQ